MERPYMYDGEVMVTKKETFEVIHCQGGQPLAIGEFRSEADAQAFAEQKRKENGEWKLER